MPKQNEGKMVNNKKRKSKKSFWFLLTVLMVYLIVAVYDLELAKEGLRKTLQMFYRIVPLLGLVLIFMTLTNLYINSGKVKKHLGQESGLKGWLYAALAGVIISGPPYIFFP